ncbi:sensor histidine kinase [Actinomadura sp. NPDC047616]|uniref:sensor histidine kinase n=1 Tax=Actinomadura sp. NPDC047616 TaxID=3155914 RepID=UPI00340B48C7
MRPAALSAAPPPAAGYDERARGVRAADADADAAADGDLWRRRLRHDIRHELGTIIMLASAVATADDIGAGSRARVEQLLGETRWLDHLLRRLEADDGPADGTRPPPGPERVRVDELAAEVVTGLRLATPRRILFGGAEAWAHMEAVALWRALRNVLDNACRVAESRVEVRVTAEGGWVIVQVDDDGPGFGSAGARTAAARHAALPGRSSLGLGIVHDIVSGHGGSLEIRTGETGGARVRLLLPSAPPSPVAASAAASAEPGRARR